MEMIPGSSTVEHSAVNRRVASSNLARGANFSFILNYLQTAIFSSLSFWAQGLQLRSSFGSYLLLWLCDQSLLGGSFYHFSPQTTDHRKNDVAAAGSTKERVCLPKFSLSSLKVPSGKLQLGIASVSS